MGTELIMGYGHTTRICFALLVVFALVQLSACNLQKENTGLNRLSGAGSPYLREHADNPVDWYEWGPEALEKAKQENKPLIISIGYASCHWCHVMEKESFMDTAVARIMNENFISIKIDREERPDIDQIYLQAAQLVSGNSGWPLNAFALPDGKPFYAATYFPREQWIQLLQQVIKAYRQDNENVVRQAESLTKGIQTLDVVSLPSDSTRLYDQPTYQNIFSSWKSSFDPKYGGLTGAPKFPMPVVWEYLLQNHYLTGNSEALEIATHTLDEISNGGIFDHLGGGFARYSTDALWRVPHFEKMLYDNGQLVSLYAHAYQVTRNPAYAEVISKTLGFVKREMTSPDGGFYSSLNADSEGEEGKFYVWTKKEIQKIVEPKASDLLIDFYQVTDSGNWENGKNVLFRKVTREEFARQRGITLSESNILLEAGEASLLTARHRRVRPSLDDKILLSWNALMMRGYIDAYLALGTPEYLQAAITNAQFLEKNMMREGGRLWRNYKDEKANIDAFLDDYALLARAFIQLYQATYDVRWLEAARSVTEYTIAHFYDKTSGLFFYTSDVSESFIARKMELPDNVIPSSNSVLAEALYLLGEYYIEDSYIQMSKSMLNQVTRDMTTVGPYYANWASLMGVISYRPFEVAIMGKEALAKSRLMQAHYLPTALFMGGEKENLPLLQNKYIEGRTIIYVCRNKTCKQPEEDAISALKQLN
jgi:uncharacterized protein YyaL (SSP411 family)